MNTPDITLKILTLGRFAISENGKAMAMNWPDETLKILFCSLLSPLDLYFTWDRMCRCMLGVPVTRTSRRKLEEILIRPLNKFLVHELGFTPLVTGPEGIRINQHGIHIDAMEFYSTVLEGLRLFSLDDHAAAVNNFNKANALYAGSYLPGIPGKIITNTRNDLEALYRSAVINSIGKSSVQDGAIK